MLQFMCNNHLPNQAQSHGLLAWLWLGEHSGQATGQTKPAFWLGLAWPILAWLGWPTGLRPGRNNTNYYLTWTVNATGDPWRDSDTTIRSAEGLEEEVSTFMHPIYESDGFHCSDLITENGITRRSMLFRWQPSST